MMINFGSVNVAFKMFLFQESSTSFAFYGNLTFKSLHLTIVAFRAISTKMAHAAAIVVLREVFEISGSI